MQQVATRDALPDGRPVKVEVDGTEIILLRDGQTVHGFAATCPHAGAPMEQAAFCDGKLICPWHKAMFAVHDGALLEPPALDPLVRYEVRVEGDVVFASARPLPTPDRPAGSADDSRTFAIVGAGAAGAAAAAALREFGFAGRVLLIGEEAGLPFDRTALSKAVLGGEMSLEQVLPLRAPEVWDKDRITVIHDRVERLDPATATLHLAGGDRIDFDAVLLASGGRAKPLDVPGADRPGVHLLRTRDDAAAILAAAHAGPRVVIVGGGFIGLEAASALRAQELEVEVVIASELPFEHVLGGPIARGLKALHERNGVRFIVGTVESIAGNDQSAPANAVVLEDGQRRPAGLVIVGVGVTPATGYADALELAEDGSLETDRSMRVADRIFAAGDIARFPFGRDNHRIRVEHWRVAQQQARVAAAAMLGRDAVFDRAPLFWTLHHGKRLEVHGHPAGFDRIEIDGDLDAFSFVARQYRGDALVGLIGCGRDTEMAALACTLSARP